MTHDEMIEAVAKAMSETETHDDTGTLADHIYQSEFPYMALAAIRVIAPAVEQETVAKIVAWLRKEAPAALHDPRMVGDEIETKWGKQ